MRALRRHHRQRLKKARKDYYGRGKITNERHDSMLVDTPTPCSCHMCANERGIRKGKERLTFPERLQIIDLKETDCE
jgi:hypothetical protein